MRRFLRHGAKRIGEVPGTVVYVGSPKDEPVRVSLYEYSEADVTERRDVSIADCLGDRPAGAIRWINVDGVHDLDRLEELADGFGLHPLTVEDIAHTGQRPKLEEYDDQLFVVLRMLRWNEATEEIDDEQVSMVVGPNWILTFQERAGDVFDPVRQRILGNRGRIRKSAIDYLAYALIDAIVDHYFTVLEHLGEEIETVEDGISSELSHTHSDALRRLKRELLFLRKSVWPLREVLSTLQRGEIDLLQESTSPFFRDVYDHTIQVIDTVETFRDLVSGLLDLYMSHLSNRMNEVMKVLTIIATIFIPLSFVAGLYGMNFDRMPELHWRYGYFGALGLMLAVALGMLAFFRRKRWL